LTEIFCEAFLLLKKNILIEASCTYFQLQKEDLFITMRFRAKLKQIPAKNTQTTPFIKNPNRKRNEVVSAVKY
jgi:hypothetical protein